jgi:hypothetical protein
VSTAVAVKPKRTAAARKVTETDKAWMAAVIDLKGAVIRKNNKMRATQQVVLYVSAKNPRIAARMSALTGTAPEEHPSPGPSEFIRRSCSAHCPAPHVHVGDEGGYPWRLPTTTRWTLTGIAAAVVLGNLSPYMSTYDQYAGDVAQILATFAARGQGSGMTRVAVARLTELGWKVPTLVKRKMAGKD